MSENDIEVQPQDIVLFHVGGSLGSYGPIDDILSCFPKQCVVFAFEVREDKEDKIIQKIHGAKGTRVVLINSCIAKTSGTFPFYINKHGESSSMLPPSPQAVDEHLLGFPPGVTTWGDNTELERMTTFKTTTLQKFIEQHDIIPDVLSLDTQGTELHIMEGTGSAISQVNSVVSEVEFLELYAGQGLFHEQMLLLDRYGFRLTDLFNSQYWHPGPICGKGFYTVAKALWFKKINTFLESNAADIVMRGIKLAAVAFAFERYSYSYALLRKLMDRDKAMVKELCNKHGFKVLIRMVNEIDNNLGKYTLDNTFFITHPLGFQSMAWWPVRHFLAIAGFQGLVQRPIRRFLARIAKKIGNKMLYYLET